MTATECQTWQKVRQIVYQSGQLKSSGTTWTLLLCLTTQLIRTPHSEMSKSVHLPCFNHTLQLVIINAVKPSGEISEAILKAKTNTKKLNLICKRRWAFRCWNWNRNAPTVGILHSICWENGYLKQAVSPIAASVKKEPSLTAGEWELVDE